MSLLLPIAHIYFSPNARLESCLTASPGCFDKCPYPTREQKDALLQEVRKTDPEYSLIKLIRWFSNRRRPGIYPESRKEHEDGRENANTFLDPTTSLARESRPYIYVDTHRGLLYLLVWPSLSVEILHRLHTLLLEQPHPAALHKELLAKHFGVEREHVENFLSWRLACLNNEDSDVWREKTQRGRKPLLTSAFDNDMEVDELLESQPYLPTPASSTSPEPVNGMTPFIRAKMDRQKSLDTGHFTPGEHEPNSPISPGPTVESNSLSPPPALQISPNATPQQVNSPVTTYFPSPVSGSPTEPTLASPLSSSQFTRPDVPAATSSSRMSNTRQEGGSRIGMHASSSVASVGKPSPQAPGPATRAPRTLHEFEEAYAPTYARIERFLRDVEANKFAHVGLTPEMLKRINP